MPRETAFLRNFAWSAWKFVSSLPVERTHSIVRGHILQQENTFYSKRTYSTARDHNVNMYRTCRVNVPAELKEFGKKGDFFN